MAEGDDRSGETSAAFLHSYLPSTFQIPYGNSVCSKKLDGVWVFSEDAESFFKEHSVDWMNIRPCESSREGSKMSSFIDRIVEKGISLNLILNRCVDIKIRKTMLFGVLNSTVNPYGTEVGAPVPTQLTNSVSFVILINKANLKRKFEEYVDLFVNILRNELPLSETSSSSLSASLVSDNCAEKPTLSSCSSSSILSNSNEEDETPSDHEPSSPSSSTTPMKRTRDGEMKKLVLENVLLTAQKNALELSNAELKDKHDYYESETHSLNIEMKVLKDLCEDKISNIESKNRSSVESGEIKAMVGKLYEYSTFEEIYECRRRIQVFLSSTDL